MWVLFPPTNYKLRDKLDHMLLFFPLQYYRTIIKWVFTNATWMNAQNKKQIFSLPAISSVYPDVMQIRKRWTETFWSGGWTTGQIFGCCVSKFKQNIQWGSLNQELYYLYSENFMKLLSKLLLLTRVIPQKEKKQCLDPWTLKRVTK